MGESPGRSRQENFRSPRARHFFLVGRKKNPNLLEIRTDQVIRCFFPSIPHGKTGAKKVLLFRRPVTRRLSPLGRRYQRAGHVPTPQRQRRRSPHRGSDSHRLQGVTDPFVEVPKPPHHPGLLTSLTSVLIKCCLTLLFEHATHSLVSHRTCAAGSPRAHRVSRIQTEPLRTQRGERSQNRR